jgi:hypothetical protein
MMLHADYRSRAYLPSGPRFDRDHREAQPRQSWQGAWRAEGALGASQGCVAGGVARAIIRSTKPCALLGVVAAWPIAGAPTYYANWRIKQMLGPH